jgi:hypothetical protein
VQKIFPPAIIEKLIPASLFSTEGVWDGFTFDKYKPDSERIHFLLKKKA